MRRSMASPARMHFDWVKVASWVAAAVVSAFAWYWIVALVLIALGPRA